jgi:lipopolysaccharide transport system permease protein
MKTRTIIGLLIFRTGANLRAEASQYYLTYLWWVLEPILMMGVFYVVFGVFLQRGTPDFVGFLLCGLTFWNWFNRSVNNASSSIMGGQSIMLQVNIPKIFFPLEVLLSDAFKQLFVTTLLLAFLLLYPTPVTITWLALPVLMFIQLIIIAGTAILCAALVPFVPDLRFIIATGLQLLFFGSGIFFSVESVVLPQHQFIMYLNPLAGLLANYRGILMYSKWPDWIYLGEVLIGASVFLLFSLWVVSKLDHVYPRVCQQ